LIIKKRMRRVFWFLHNREIEIPQPKDALKYLFSATVYCCTVFWVRACDYFVALLKCVIIKKIISRLCQ